MKETWNYFKQKLPESWISKVRGKKNYEKKYRTNQINNHLCLLRIKRKHTTEGKEKAEDGIIEVGRNSLRNCKATHAQTSNKNFCYTLEAHELERLEKKGPGSTNWSQNK